MSADALGLSKVSVQELGNDIKDGCSNGRRKEMTGALRLKDRVTVITVCSQGIRLSA